jgi:hypothetical protein
MHCRGRYEEAESFAERSIIIFENTLGERHPETTQSMEMMVRLMRTTHREREAQNLQARLNTIREDPSADSESSDATDQHGNQ